MPSMNPCLVLMLLSVFSFTSLADSTYMYHFCSNETGNSPFLANRNSLVSDLSTNAIGRDGFYNSTAGQRPNTVYGLFLCRGDLIPENCQNCIDLVVADVVQRCPNGTWAIIWYDQCMLRYSNQSIFSSMAVTPNRNLSYHVDVMEPDRFSQLMGTLMKDVATRASNASLGAKKFATKDATFNQFQTLYSLAQCTPDISGEDCYSCLEQAIAGLESCCNKRPGAFALYPSCTVQFQTAPFYQQSNNTTADAPPPALPPPPLLLPSTPPGLFNNQKIDLI